MMLTTRCWGVTTVLLCALLLQDCQSNALRATEEKACDGQRWEQGCVRRDALDIPLNVAVSEEPDKASECLEVCLAVAQDKQFRQQALETFGKVAQASPDMVSACLPSLHAAAKTWEDKAVRLLALKTLGEVEWKHYFGGVEAAPALPNNMAAILDSACPFWKGKKVKDTHLLVLMPKTVDGAPFTLNLLGELIQRPKNGGHRTKYSYYDYEIQAQFGAASPDRSYWLLITRDVLEGSRSKAYSAQRELVESYAGGDGRPYEVPGALEAATAILMHHICTGEWIFGDDALTYTRCRELVSGKYPVAVGGFEPSGLNVDDIRSFDYFFLGVAGCRKFYEGDE